MSAVRHFFLTHARAVGLFCHHAGSAAIGKKKERLKIRATSTALVDHGVNLPIGPFANGLRGRHEVVPLRKLSSCLWPQSLLYLQPTGQVSKPPGLALVSEPAPSSNSNHDVIAAEPRMHVRGRGR